MKEFETRIQTEAEDSQRGELKRQQLNSVASEQKDLLGSLEKDKEDLDKERTTLKQQLSSLRTERDNKKEQLKQLKQKTSNQESEIKTLKDRAEDYGKNVSSIRIKNKEVEAKVNETNLALETEKK